MDRAVNVDRAQACAQSKLPPCLTAGWVKSERTVGFPARIVGTRAENRQEVGLF
jgi:hypothetical protein